METNKILSADILDILFEGKNKDYGAYELRKTDNRRIITALCFTALAIIIILCSFVKSENNESKKSQIVEFTDPKSITNDPKILPKKLIIPAQPKIKTAAFPPPIIVIDKLVIDPPVENNKFDDAKISLKTTDGNIGDGISAPVEIKQSNVIEAPHKLVKTEDSIVTFVEIEARFSGSWTNYVKKEIEKHLDELTDAGESGTCMVKFIVYKDGTVSNVEATTMKGSKLAEISINAIRKGSKWIPAMRNGQYVNAYRLQPVTLHLDDQ